MIKIGKTYLVYKNEQVRLCSDITINERTTTIWYGVEREYEEYLTKDAADPFVMVMLPAAMRKGYDIVSEMPMSARLHYQLQEYLVPTLASVGGRYQSIKIHAPLHKVQHKNAGAVGTGFSAGVDSLYTIMMHGKEALYPLTHIAVFNVGVFEGSAYRESFRKSCSYATEFARENDLKTVFLDSNLFEALPERFLDVYSFRNLSGALALQGLFDTYLLSSGHDAAHFSLNLDNAAYYDLLTVNCAGTEAIRFYLSGVEVKRHEKTKLLSDWEPSYNWFNPCIYTLPGQKNCGHCKKCVNEMTVLYAYGKLDNYKKVFDVATYRKRLSQNMGLVMANRDDHLYGETCELLEEQGVEIPKAAYIFEQQFTRAMNNLKGSQKVNED